MFTPTLRPSLVPRPRLIAKLGSGLTAKLILVSAPAGYGKTTLVSDWVRHMDQPAAWLSLDPDDNDPVRFLTYLVAALRQINPEIGQTALGLLETSQFPRPEILLTALINDIATLRAECVLVFDDYHVIDDRTIHDALDFLVRHMPSRLHLVIVSRRQPPFDFARLRGQGQLLELTSADLRFTAAEVETFFKDVMKVDLSPAERTALEMWTEGWIAALQMAALAIQARQSVQGQTKESAFIASFGGTDRYIADYLFEEVLQHQPDEVRHFLLATSVVDRLCSSLCNAILNASGSQAMLERLEAFQLFIVPLDNRRQWYRYHHLFVDLLRHHLRERYSEELPLLHRRASLWFEQHGRAEDAIRHSLKAQDYARAAGLLETAFQQRDWVQHNMRRLLGWYEALPTAVSRSRPKLKLGVAWLLFEIFSDQWDRIESLLRQVEDALRAPHADASFPAREARAMLASVDLLRANHARHAGDPVRVIAICEQALDRLPAGEAYLRSGAIAHLASAYESLGNMQQASQLYSESIEMCRAANNVDGLLFAAARLTAVLSLRGELRQARIVFGQARDYAEERTGPDMGLVYITIGDVYREQNDLEQARSYLQEGLDLCRPFDAWRSAVTTGVISLARLLMAEGHDDEAMDALLEMGERPPPIAPQERARLESTRARLWLAQGDYGAAARWALHSGLSVKGDPDYERESHYLTLARVLIAQAELEARGIQPPRVAANPLASAHSLLERLHGAAQAGGRTGRVIEVRVLQALLYALRQEATQATNRLAEALSLADGHVRLFVDEGRPAHRLLTLLLTHPSLSVSSDYVRTILAAFPRSLTGSGQAALLPGNALTKRERETLRLLATELSMAEIAAAMTVSVSTVRTYAKRIYSKLSVHSRAEAVYRARELKLL